MTFVEFVRRALAVAAIATLFFVLILGFWTLRTIFLIGFTCWIISVGLSVPVNKLQQRGMRRRNAMLITIFSTIAIIIFLGAWLLPPIALQIVDLVEELPDAAEAAVQEYEDIRDGDSPLSNLLPEFTVRDYNSLISGETDIGESEFGLDLENVAGSALPFFRGVGSFLGDFFANTFIIIIISIYLLAGPIDYYRIGLALLPTKNYTRAVEIINLMQRSVRAWMASLAISITATATLTFIVLGLLLNIPNALALGAIAGLGGFIPYVGYYIGLIPIFIFTLADDPNKLLFAIPAYIVIGELESKLITPSVVKNELSIPAGVMLLFQLVMISLFGFFGILLAVPILAVLMVLVRELYVYDVLGKRGLEYELSETEDGKLQVQMQTDAG